MCVACGKKVRALRELRDGFMGSCGEEEASCEREEVAMEPSFEW